MNEIEIRLRAVEPEDADLLFMTENDDNSWGDSDTLAPFSRRLIREYAAGYQANPLLDGQLRLIATESVSGRPVGILDFYEIEVLHRRSYIAIYVLPEERGRGYATAILSAAADYAYRRLGLMTLAAKILISNKLSIRVFEKNGYKLQGILPNWHFSDGRFSDVALYIRNLGSLKI